MKNRMKLNGEEINKKKSMKISIFLHASILAFGLLPLTQKIMVEQEKDFLQIIPIEFAEFASKSEGLQARSAKVVEEVKPVNDSPNEERGTESVEPAEELVPVVEEDVVESEIIEEVESEVSAAEDSDVEEAEEAAMQGGYEASNMQGDSEGSAEEGEDSGSNGIDGDGIITRKIIHRENIGKVAKESGTIVMNLCIDRFGKVVEIKNNAELTTISDMDIIRQALRIASHYLFERDYTAAKKECGKLTFIFDIEGRNTNGYLVME